MDRQTYLSFGNFAELALKAMQGIADQLEL
jgi:hypothetical protein